MVAALVLVARYVAAIARSQSGPAIFQDAWNNALQAVAGREGTPVHQRLPREQAEFWLARTASLPDDPLVLCGAALLLDGPHPAYQSRMLKRTDHQFVSVFPGLVPTVEFDRAAIKTAAEEFESLVVRRRLALLERATALAPGNRDLWRTRALLQFHGFMSDSAWKPRTEAWPAVLDEAQRHDPDNALYDLIAALQIFRQSADLDLSQPDLQLIVHNRWLFEDGVERLARGLARPHLQFGASRSHSLWRGLLMIGGAGVHPLQHAGGSDFDGRVVLMLRELVRSERARCDLVANEGNRRDALRGLDLLRRLPRQMETREGNDASYVKLPPLFEQIILANVEAVRLRIPEAESELDGEQLTFQREAAKTRSEEIETRAAVPHHPPVHVDRIGPLIAGYMAALAPIFLIPCLIGCGALVIAGRLLQRRSGSSPASASPESSPARRTLSAGGMLLLWLGGLVLVAGWVWIGTFWQGRSTDSAPAAVLDELILEKWGRFGLAGVTFLRGPVCWKLICATLCLLLFWSLLRQARSNPAGWRGVWSAKGLWAGEFFLNGARLLLATAALLTLLHVIGLPTQVIAVDDLQRQWLDWASNPHARWTAWDQTQSTDLAPAAEP